MSEERMMIKRGLTQQQKKRYAKYAMGAAIALLFATGYSRSKTAKRIHEAAGFALLGLTVYHVTRYPKSQRS